MMHGDIAWAAVADGGRLRILERAVRRAPWLELAAEAARHPDPPSRSLGTDRPGRSHESVGSARHAIEPRQDLHEAAEAAFAREVADRLERAASAGRFGRLVLVALPAFLGRLRPALGEQARRRLAGTLNRDLTHLPEQELAARLAEEDLPQA
jgi:protein required for attachment to host cells